MHDLVRGDLEFPLRALEDFICVEGNGKPLFVLANAVDESRHGHHARDPR